MVELTRAEQLVCTEQSLQSGGGFRELRSPWRPKIKAPRIVSSAALPEAKRTAAAVRVDAENFILSIRVIISFKTFWKDIKIPVRVIRILPCIYTCLKN